jgi:phosphate:Na+ symporter
MSDLILSVLQVLGSLGLFVYGMKITSEALQRVAGERLAKLLQHNAPDSFFKGIIKGSFINGLVQSSTATSLMTISFVNAGLLSFEQSINVIMGINLGSSVTAWLIAVIGFQFTLSNFSVALIGFFFPFIFSKKDTLKNLAEFAIGLGILLLGAEFLKEIIPFLNTNYNLAEWLMPFTHSGYLSIILFLIIGSIATYILQSSSAVLAISLIFLIQDWLSLEAAAALALGENLGTAFNTHRIAQGGNIHAKRAAGFHLYFNIGGVIWMFLFMPVFLTVIGKMINIFSLVMPISESNKVILSLPLFHTLFNISNIVLLTGFIPVVERYLLDKFPASGKTDEEFHLRYINNSLLATPELALMEAKKELQTFAKIIEQMSEALSTLLFEQNMNNELIIRKLMKREEQTDSLELEVANYLTKLSESELSREGSQKVRSMLNIANNLERVADIYYQMTKNFQRMEKMNISFPDETMRDIREMLNLLNTAIKHMRENMELESDKINLERIYEIESRIDARHKELTSDNFERLEKGIYDPRAGVIFMDFVNRAERIGDHIVNVNEALDSTGGFLVKKIS